MKAQAAIADRAGQGVAPPEDALAARDLRAAAEAYRAGDYATAAALYEAAIDAGADGADVHFNLGNALYRAGEVGRAALAFERALRRDPGDAGARANLALVRGESAGAPLTLLDRIGARVDPGDAAAILLAAWSLACAVWILRRVLRRGALRVVATAALIALLVASASAGVATFAGWRLREAGWAVVVAPGEARRAPEPGADPVAPLQEGARVRAERRLGAWALVRFDGGAGWIEAARIEPIDPRGDAPLR